MRLKALIKVVVTLIEVVIINIVFSNCFFRMAKLYLLYFYYLDELQLP